MTVETTTAAGGDEVPALRKRVAELERLLAERDVELELERGKVVMGTTALAEANRRCADAEHQLQASGVADAQDAAAADLAKAQAEAKAKANPHWTPNGASPPRSARKGARAGSPLILGIGTGERLGDHYLASDAMALAGASATTRPSRSASCRRWSRSWRWRRAICTRRRRST